jgi:hypothetical protein
LQLCTVHFAGCKGTGLPGYSGDLVRAILICGGFDEGAIANWNMCRPDVETSYNLDKNAITKYAPQFAPQVYAVTVGSETLYRGNFTGDQLLSKINDIKSALKGTNIKVGTADSWNKYADGTADAVIKGNPDIL